jgi:hypothetical protein
MNLGKLAGQAKKLIDKRGGMGSLKEDAAELKNIAGEKGSLADKARHAGEALKDPGAPGDSSTPPAQTPSEQTPSAQTPPPPAAP